MNINFAYLEKMNEAGKRIVRRNLPVNQDYKLLNTGTLDSENATTCQNCNMVITSYAEITNDKNTYTVGMDCLTTLLSFNSWEDKYKMAETYGKMQKELRFRGFIRKLKKAGTLHVDVSEYTVQVKEGKDIKYNVRREYWNKLNITL